MMMGGGGYPLSPDDVDGSSSNQQRRSSSSSISSGKQITLELDPRTLATIHHQYQQNPHSMGDSSASGTVVVSSVASTDLANASLDGSSSGANRGDTSNI